MRTGTNRSRAQTRRVGTIRLLPVLALAVAVLACGCVEVKDTLTINADGSGTVRIETVVHQAAMFREFGYRRMMGYGDAALYPPPSTQSARMLFPGDDFDVDVKRNPQGDSTTGVIVEVEFEDVNALINSPYGQAHSLRLERDGDELVLTARSGMEHVARSEPLLKADYEEGVGEMFEDAAEKYDELAFEFTIVLPGTAEVEGAGATADGNSVTWAVDVSEAEDRATAVEQLDAVVTARCRVEDLAFTPEPVVRLDLCAFDELADGKLADAPAVDVENVKAEARFLPLVLRVARSFDLAGVGSYYSEENGITLEGFIVVPRELEPERWGEPKVTEATDDQGTDLLPGDDEDDMSRWMTRRVTTSMSFSGFGEEEEDEGPDALYPFEAYLEPPDFDATAIASIKGTVTMHYPGAQHLIRIKDAVDDSAITDTSIDDYEMYSFDEDEGTPLSSDALSELGIELELAMAARMPGLMMLRFAWDDEHGTIERVQVFDADGRPWRTAALNRDMLGFMYEREKASFVVMVVGAPKPPLSLAIEVRTAGPSVTVPFEIKDVPLTPRAVRIEPPDDDEEEDVDLDEDVAKEEHDDVE